MLSGIRLKNFKCFSDETFKLSPLTVLSGINGMGKSTVLQSLLMLRQSIISNSLKDEGALLNGPLVHLGLSDDIMFDYVEGDDDEIILNVMTDTENKLTFQFSPGSKFLYNHSYHDLPNVNIPEISGDNFFYLQAERYGPRTSYVVADKESSKYNPIGNAGEYCAHILSSFARQPIGISSLSHPKESIKELRFQVEAWLAEVGQTPRIHLTEHKKLDLVELGFSFLKDGIPGNTYRPTNVGFGLSYSLPIFVTVLISKPNNLILIENPEAHLHPKGQAAMGKFLAKAASKGVQIILETHSDHILNGIRIAVKKGEIKPNEVSLLFFNRSSETGSTKVIQPVLDENGRINEWPDGFFDELEIELSELL